MVEEQWADVDTKPAEYVELYNDVLRFMDIKNSAFHAWRDYDLERPKSALVNQESNVLVTPLHIAAAYGLPDLCGRLLEQEAERKSTSNGRVNELSANKQTTQGSESANEVIHATTQSVNSSFQVSAESAIHARDTNGTTPLFWACLVTNLDRRYQTCKLLLERGAHPGLEALRQDNGEFVDMETPFHALLYNNATDLQMVKLFLDHGAVATEIDPYGYNALHDFAWAGSDPAILDLLIEAGADINVRDTGGETPLHKLLNGRGEEVPITLLKRFLYHKADIAVDDKYEQQALYEVAQGGSAEAMKLILANDPAPDVNHREYGGWMALHSAARWGNLKCCKLLSEAGADLLAIDNRGASVLYLSCYSDSVETVDYLASAGIEKDEDFLRRVTNDEKTALRKAAALGKKEVVKLLLTKYRHYVDIDRADKVLAWTPLHIAAYIGASDIVELLLDHGADGSKLDKRGKTALTLCYQQWELLHATDAMRDASFESSLVALIDADRAAAVAETHLLSAGARKGSIAVLEALVLGPSGQPRADPVLRDEFGWTAVELARQFKRQLAVDFLQQHSGFTGRYPDEWRTTKPEVAKFDAQSKELSYVVETSGGDSFEHRLTLFANCPIPASLDRYYYEVTIEFPDPEKASQESHTIGIGVFSLGASRYANGVGLEWSFPGHANTSKRGTQSWAYHGDDEWIGSSLYGYRDDHQLRTETFGHGDTVGCGVDFRKGYIFWTKNGRRLSTAT